MENTVNPVPQIPVIVDKPNPNYLNLFLITFAFVLFSLGVYFLGRQSMQVVQTPPIPVLPQTTVIPTLTVPTDLKSYTDEALGISIQYPSKYIQSYTQDTNYYALELLGPDYRTEGNDMGVMRKGTYFILSNNNTCAPSSHVSLDTLIEKNNRYSLYKIKGVEGPDYKVALFKTTDNKCIDVVCSSNNFCEGEVFADFNQTLSTFKFTESKAENQFKLGSSNFFLDLPSNFLINKNNITLGTSIYNISTFVGPGLCPMDPDDDSCSYYENKDTAWGTYKVWTKNSKPFAINPISIEISKKYFEGLIITKSKPNEFFTQAELLSWKDILNKISYSEE